MPIWTPAASAGGGGAALVYDGATLTIGEVDSENAWYPVEITLTLDGTPIAGEAMIRAYIRRSNGVFLASNTLAISNSSMTGFKLQNGTDREMLYYYIYPGGNAETVYVTNPGGGVATAHLGLILPTGGIVASANGLVWGD